MKSIVLFLVTITSIIFMDIIWLGFIAKNIYAQNIGLLLRPPIWWSAILAYVCITIGILFFVLPKAQGDYLIAFAYGTLFGMITYGIYNFTNYSILARWSLTITFIDLMWGIILCGLASFFSAFIQNRFFS